jgi:uncharacterized membrane protein
MDVLAAFRRPPFLTATEREQVEAGLATARRHAGAPIGLVIDEASEGDPAIRAERLLLEWDLAEAERPAAVLVYACAATRRFAVVGGEAIRRVAPQAFWDALDRDLTRHFGEGRYCDGLFKAVAQVAIQLQHHFPRDAPPPADGPPDSD